MGFKYWVEAFWFVMVFGVIVLVPCFFIATIGAKMFNEIGNFPSRSDQIQSATLWKALLIFLAAVGALTVFFHAFN